MRMFAGLVALSASLTYGLPKGNPIHSFPALECLLEALWTRPHGYRPRSLHLTGSPHTFSNAHLFIRASLQWKLGWSRETQGGFPEEWALEG